MKEPDKLLAAAVLSKAVCDFICERSESARKWLQLGEPTASSVGINVFWICKVLGIDHSNLSNVLLEIDQIPDDQPNKTKLPLVPTLKLIYSSIDGQASGNSYSNKTCKD